MFLKKVIPVVILLFLSTDGYSQKKKKRVSDRNQNIVETVIESSEKTIVSQTLKRKVAIARFSNETSYAKGLFYDKDNDPMEKQAVDILSTKLASSGKFILLEREDFNLIENELKIADNENYEKIGADFLIIGSITGNNHSRWNSSPTLLHYSQCLVSSAVSI